jgi:transposase InsO family protein
MSGTRVEIAGIRDRVVTQGINELRGKYAIETLASDLRAGCRRYRSGIARNSGPRCCDQSAGLERAESPPHCSQVNAIRERVIGTIRRECRDRLIPLSQGICAQS